MAVGTIFSEMRGICSVSTKLQAKKDKILGEIMNKKAELSQWLAHSAFVNIVLTSVITCVLKTDPGSL